MWMLPLENTCWGVREYMFWEIEDVLQTLEYRDLNLALISTLIKRRFPFPFRISCASKKSSFNKYFWNILCSKGQNKEDTVMEAKQERFCNDTNGDTYPEGGRYWVNCNHGYCECTGHQKHSKKSSQHCHLNQHSFATCARGIYYSYLSEYSWLAWLIFWLENIYAFNKGSFTMNVEIR